jgi:four helix bundle protein
MRNSDREFARFASIALGSLAELEFQLNVCTRLGYLPASVSESFNGEIASLRRQISRLRGSLVAEASPAETED